MSVHENTLQGLQEALDYVKGDKTKGRSVFVDVPDDADFGVLIYQKIMSMPEPHRRQVAGYVDGLLQASNQ